MMKMKNIKRELYIYFILDFILLIFSFYKGLDWVFNSQMAFFSSLSIIMLSMLAYIKKINKQVSTINQKLEIDRDYIDEIDDPYELFGEDNDNKKEKTNNIKISIKNLSKLGSSTFSFYRLLGYAILIFGFFLLLDYNVFKIFPYLLGISVIPVGTLLSAYKR